MGLEEKVERLYREFGPGKPMGIPAPDTQHPHYFLHRNFLGEQDLLIIFNTKRCRYQCHFCGLPLKSSLSWISGDDILAQFEYVLNEVRHSLGVLDRVTLSNDGSILDTLTFPTEALLTIVKCTRKLKNVRRIVLETRLEFVDPEVIRKVKDTNPMLAINILTGFESLNPHIRDVILFKQETLGSFLAGLDKVAECEAELTAFVLFKPSYRMTDEEAIVEAEASIDYLVWECHSRNIALTIRLGPMYAARRSKWAKQALAAPEYKPPRLTDALALARKKAQEGVKIYLGLSNEGVADPQNSYMGREDYSKDLLRQAIEFNYGKVSRK